MIVRPHKAKYGDCVQISWTDSQDKIRNIIVDGGPGSSYNDGLCAAVKAILVDDKQDIDLLIITHYDLDHIEGVLNLFSDKSVDHSRIKKVIFNSKKLVENKSLTDWEAKFEEIDSIESKKLAFGDLVTLTNVLEQKKIRVNESPLSRDFTPPIEVDNLKIHVIAPGNDDLNRLFDSEPKFPAGDKSEKEMSIEEYSNMPDSNEDKIVHGASLSFIFELDGKRFLYLSDTTCSSYLDGLLQRPDESFEFDLIKLSHHGSKYNINSDFIQKIRCDRFLICTSGTRYNHPHKVTMAKIAASNTKKGISTTFCLNYPIHRDWFEKERKAYNLRFETPDEILL